MSKVLSQQVVNPVGDGNNTDEGSRRNPPSNCTSAQVALDQQVVNPVGTKMNTDGGPQNSCQAPLPMRPIPS